jgi:cytochrome c-type biogenesis protein CcmH
MSCFPSSALRAPSPDEGSGEGHGVAFSRPSWREKVPEGRMRELGLAFAILALMTLPAHAVQPDEILKDPVLETRARSISAGLRCLVCQNQSIDDSDATVAKDLRILIREQLQANKSDAEVVDFVVARYGDFVLLKPRLKPSTLILWFSPFVILLAGLGFAFRRRATIVESKLTPGEEAEVAAILRK